MPAGTPRQSVGSKKGDRLPDHHRGSSRIELVIFPLDPVIIPGRAFVHDREAEEVLSRGGMMREVIRGPDCLTADAETSMGMSRDEVLALEMEGFSTLIQTINRYGR